MLIARALYVLERFLVGRADRIIGTWRYFDRYIEEIGGDPEKVEWIPQVADLDRRPASLPAAPEDGPFTVMYTGGIVNYMGVDVMLRAAKILQERGAGDIRFDFVGGGQEKPNLVRMAEDLGLSNVRFLDPVPKDQLYATMASAHAFIVSLRAYPHHRYGVCLNKLCDYLAMERPIIYATRSTYNPVADARAGIAIEPESPERMADAILDLKSSRRAYQHLTEYHERARVTKHLENFLFATCAASQES